MHKNRHSRKRSTSSNIKRKRSNSSHGKRKRSNSSHRRRRRSRSRSHNQKHQSRHDRRSQDRKKEKNQQNVIEEKKIILKESDLIDALREEPNYLQAKYNQEKQPQKKIVDQQLTRAGGVYIPPQKLAQLQQEILQNEQKYSIEHQKLMFELLRKSINQINNKVNVTNIQNVIIELLNENLIRGKGLLARAIIKGQMASPNFTYVYAGLIAVLNTRLPEIVALIIKRVALQFQKAFKRNNKIVCMATTKMLAHLINQQVISEFVGLQLLTLLLENPTEDSVEIACDFMIEAGKVMSDLTPAGVNAVFERFKGILHEGEIDKRVQYSIEHLFAVRKTKFKDHPGVPPELDLVEQEDQITHDLNLDDTFDGEERLNIFKYDPFYEKTEEEWNAIKLEILGEENILKLKTLQKIEESISEEEEQVEDLTEQDLKNLRRKIYLTIMNSIDFEDCAHKMIKSGLGNGQEKEMVEMFIECCFQERTYLRFYGLLCQRYCQLFSTYKELFEFQFQKIYQIVHQYETNKLRSLAKLFSHLLFTNAINWNVLCCVVLTQEQTTSSSRIFIKILFQDLQEQIGLEKLNQRLQDPEYASYFEGIFPKDNAKNVRFSINFFTSIGLGAITEAMREYLQKMPKLMPQQQENSSSQSSESSDSSDSSDSESSDSESDSD